MYDESDKTYLIGPYVIEIWEGQHPHEHDHCWKWRVSEMDAGGTVFHGFREFQEDAHQAALKALTFHSLRNVEDRDALEMLWPGFKSYQPRPPGLP